MGKPDDYPSSPAQIYSPPEQPPQTFRGFPQDPPQEGYYPYGGYYPQQAYPPWQGYPPYPQQRMHPTPLIARKDWATRITHADYVAGYYGQPQPVYIQQQDRSAAGDDICLGM